MIKVTVHLKGPLKKYGPGEEIFEFSTDVSSCTLSDLLKMLNIPASSVSFIQVDDGKSELETELKGGEKAVFYPRVSGG